MESGKYYVIADGNNLYEGLTKEQILAAITQAVESHAISDVDTGFVTTLKEQNRNKGLKVWVGTSAEYNAIQTKETNCLYILSDDTELEDLEMEILRLGNAVESITSLKGQVLVNDTVSYGSGLSIAIGGDYNISQYSVVKVSTTIGEALCTVQYGGEGTAAIIRGIAPDNLRSATATSFTTILSIKIYCDPTTNTITENASTSTLFSTSGGVQISQMTVNKIVGVY